MATNLKNTYSIDELVSSSPKAAKLSRRKVRFYIQQGLLPRPGRNGPETVYPESTLHRLQVINRVKLLLDQRPELRHRFGESVLKTLKDWFDRSANEPDFKVRLAKLASGEEPIEVLSSEDMVDAAGEPIDWNLKRKVHGAAVVVHSQVKRLNTDAQWMAEWLTNDIAILSLSPLRKKALARIKKILEEESGRGTPHRAKDGHLSSTNNGV